MINKKTLKKIPGLVSIKRLIWSIFDFNREKGQTNLNLVKTFPLYQPCSAGSYDVKSQLTIQTINEVFPSLCALVKNLNGSLLPIEDVVNFPANEIEKNAAVELMKYFDLYGSDKSDHKYHFLYGSILSNKNDIKNIFEIGLGTNNTDVVSNMGTHGQPGASLRAFRDHCPNANIYGADIDLRILFQDDRIHTYYVDQTEPSTFSDLLMKVPNNFDLVIDDGLHSPNANIATLKFGLNIIKRGGWVVVEDIGFGAIDFWQVTAALLPSKYRCHIFKANEGIIFAVQRVF